MPWPWKKIRWTWLDLVSLIEISLDLDKKFVECQYNFASWILHHLASHSGVLLEILRGGVQPGSPNPDPISDQKMPLFHTSSFQTRPLKSLTVFRPVLKAEVISSFLRLERKQKFLQKHFEFAYSITTFIHSRISLQNHTRFQTKMGKVYTRFQTKKAEKPYPLGRHISIWLI